MNQKVNQLKFYDFYTHQNMLIYVESFIMDRIRIQPRKSGSEQIRIRNTDHQPFFNIFEWKYYLLDSLCLPPVKLHKIDS
jgi:hypothetical protein